MPTCNGSSLRCALRWPEVGAPMAKRCFDLVCAGLGLVLLAPLLASIALWIKLDSRGPVFFRQQRVGRFGALFSIHKFRTMRAESFPQSQRAFERMLSLPIYTRMTDADVQRVADTVRRALD